MLCMGKWEVLLQISAKVTEWKVQKNPKLLKKQEVTGTNRKHLVSSHTLTATNLKNNDLI